MRNTVVIAALVTCLKVLIPLKTRWEHLDLVWVLWTLNKCENGIKISISAYRDFMEEKKKCPFFLSWFWGSISGFFFFSLLPSSLLYFSLCSMATFKTLNITVIAALHGIWSLGKLGILEIDHPLKPRDRTLVKLFLLILVKTWWHSCAIKTSPKTLTGKGAVKNSRLWDFEWVNFCASLKLLDQSVTIAHGWKNFEG